RNLRLKRCDASKESAAVAARLLYGTTSAAVPEFGAFTRVIPRCAIAHRGWSHRVGALRRPMTGSGPDLRCAIAHRGISRFRVRVGACHRAALRADPLARPGMTATIRSLDS